MVKIHCIIIVATVKVVLNWDNSGNLVDVTLTHINKHVVALIFDQCFWCLTDVGLFLLIVFIRGCFYLYFSCYQFYIFVRRWCNVSHNN